MKEVNIQNSLESGGVSVIIPCYNSESTISVTLESILNQCVQNMEVIVVDDGSTDRTHEIVGRFEPTIRYEYQQNQGVSAARNKGVNMAQKEWIAFCDADDIWCPNKMMICNEVMKNNMKCQFVFHDYSVMYGNQIVAERGTHSEHSFFPMLKYYSVTIPQILTRHSNIVLKNSEGETINIDTYYGNGFQWMILGNFIMPSSVVMKRKLFIDKGGFDKDFKVAEDTELFLRLAKDTNFLYIDHPFHFYRRTADSLISKNRKETIIYGIKGIQKNCLAYEEIKQNYKKQISSSLGRRWAALAYFHLSELDKLEAIKATLNAIRYDAKSFLPWKVMLLSLMPRIVLRKAREMKKRRKFIKSQRKK